VFNAFLQWNRRLFTQLEYIVRRLDFVIWFRFLWVDYLIISFSLVLVVQLVGLLSDEFVDCLKNVFYHFLLWILLLLSSVNKVKVYRVCFFWRVVAALVMAVCFILVSHLYCYRSYSCVFIFLLEASLNINATFCPFHVLLFSWKQKTLSSS